MKKIKIMIKPGAGTRRIKKSKIKLKPSPSEANHRIIEKLLSTVKNANERNQNGMNEEIKHAIKEIALKSVKDEIKNVTKEISHQKISRPRADDETRKKFLAKLNELESKLKSSWSYPTRKEKIVADNEREENAETEEKTYGGIEIPATQDSVKKEIEELTEEERQNIDIKYPLFPKNSKIENALAYAHIHWSDKYGNLIYEVIEPKISEQEKKQMFVIKEYIEDKINIVFDEINKKEAVSYLDKKIDEAFKYFQIHDEEKKRKLKYYIFRDFLGLEKIDALMRDSRIEDISCDGVGIPIFVYHKDNRIGSIATNIKFNSKEELDEFVMKIAEKCKKSISILKPLLDSSLPDGSRVQATLGSDIAHKGSNFTIRKFPEMPLTPTDMLLNGTMDLNIATYLWFLIENSSSTLISGGTATGKTSLLNAISLFIPREAKIISIEDTAEIRLIHPNWIPEIARESPIGGVTMFDLLKESLRQRPDYIIVGEVRGKEAYVLFQQMATGHPGISTIHAEDFNKLLDRLTTPPINLSPSLIESLNIIIFLKRIRYKNRYIRRVNEVIEVLGFDRKTNQPITRRIFHWDADHDRFVIDNKSYILEKVRSTHGMLEEEIKKEFKNRAKLLKWICLREINDYRIFTRVIDLYKMNKDGVLERIEAEL